MIFGRIKINQQRLTDDLLALAKIGATPEGGVTRTAHTMEEILGRDWVEKRMQEANLKTWIDPVGNLHGRREGTLKDSTPVVSGSHVDTVLNGGRFDGAAGVLAALEAIRAIDEANIITDHPLEVICMLAEEPSRFGLSCYASRALKGGIGDEQLARVDQTSGMTLDQTLRELGINPDKFKDAILEPGAYKAFIELHIEMWKELDNKKIPIGVISDIVAPTRYRVKFQGEATHPGSTPMNKRKDALVAASESIIAIENLASQYQDKDIVATVGQIWCNPNQLNIVPGSTEITFEVRGRYHFSKDIVVDEIIDVIRQKCGQRQVLTEFSLLMRDKSVKLADTIIKVLSESAEECGLEYQNMPSRGGHDALHLAEKVSVGMIFVPSKDGLGHVPGEWTSPEDLAAGTAVLAKAMVKLAQKDYLVKERSNSHSN